MKQVHLRQLILFLALLISVGCKNDSRTEQRLKKLEEENKELKRKLNNESSTKENNLEEINKPTYQSQNAKYVFVILEVSQREYAEDYMGKITKKYNYCSDVESLYYVDEDIKYQLMDRVQGSYLNSASARVYQGQVNKRQVFVFESYEAASKEREKYLVSK